MTPTTQRAQIKAALERGERITPKDARRICKCDRLAARIHELRLLGMEIDKRMVKRGDSYVAEYALVRKEAA